MKKYNLNDIRKVLLYVSIIIIIISTIILIITKSEVVDLIFSTILISLSINIISSLILIFLLDKRKEEEEYKENQKKQLLVANNLISIIKDFNELIANMYKATMKEPIQENDNILKDLYYDINKLYNQINKIDLTKNGYMCIPIDDNFNTITLSWKECYFKKLNKYIEQIKEISISYFYIIDSQLMESINQILKNEKNIGTIKNNVSVEILNKYVEDLENKNIPNTDNYNKEKLAFWYTGLINILLETSTICKYINNLTNRNNFSLPISTFNSSGISPIIGSGLMENQN